jgi:hypothetical protein
MSAPQELVWWLKKVIEELKKTHDQVSCCFRPAPAAPHHRSSSIMSVWIAQRTQLKLS